MHVDVKWKTVVAKIRELGIGPVGLACTTALLTRTAVFILLITFPIADGSGNLISPMHYQSSADYPFYMKSMEFYEGVTWSDLYDRILKSFDEPFSNLYTFVMSGPVLPYLFILFQYSADNTLPLSLVSLAIGTLTAWMWIVWLDRRGVRAGWLIIFALLPNPIWYQVNNTADIYLAFFVALFCLLYLSNPVTYTWITLGIACGFMALLTKPNGLPLIIFMCVNTLLLYKDKKHWITLTFIAGSGVLCIAFFIFYTTYLISFLESSKHLGYFGVPYGRYIHGLFDFLPIIIDLTLSWLSLIGAKMLYLVGLRPSYGVTPVELVMVRAAAGLVLLPGLLWLLVYRPKREALFVLLYIAPPFLGATQERYLLPILPLVFFYGVLAIESTYRRLRYNISFPEAKRARGGGGVGLDEQARCTGPTYRKKGSSGTAGYRQLVVGRQA